jgi:glycosyltransferase involved in cell wall biosynthesis
VELHIYGDSGRFAKYGQELQRIAGEVDGVLFEGAYDNARVFDILADTDAIIVPSLWFEVSPFVVLEALSVGVPIIASDLPNLNRQVRDGVDGLLFPAGSPEGLRAQLQRLVDEPDLPGRLGGGGRSIRTVDEEMAEIEKIYQQLARMGAGRGSLVPS